MAQLLEVDGAGNRFVLLDARGEGPRPDSADIADLVLLARQVTTPGGEAFAGRGADGLLAVLAQEGTDVPRLVIVNRDGTRPEMCGNGLRCVVRYLVEGDPGEAVELAVDTDAGRLAGRTTRAANGWRVAVAIGRGRITADFVLPFPGVPRGLVAAAVDVGNPHCVLDASALGVRLEEAPLAEVAAAVLATGRFPAGVNVELVEVHGDHLRARVLERGVGETAACGTGAGAIATVALERLDLGAPVRIHMPGGVLEIDRDGAGGLWLAGPAELGRRLDDPRP